MKDDLTLIAVVLDRSGSMSSIRTDMEGGLNTFIKEQAAEPGECRLTLAQFDTKYEVLADYIDIRTAPKFQLVPRNGTALLDAIGKTVTEVGEKLAALPEAQRPSKVVVMIVTDGLENSSREWKSGDVMSLIKRQTEQWAWQFVYLGANQDAIAVGQGLAVPAASSMTYDATSQGTRAMFTNSSASIRRYRGGQGQTVAFTEEERREVREER
jgi:uncharacterized protein YegL